MSSLKKFMNAAAGTAAASGGLYVEEVFSTYLYTGNGTTGQTITNGIDLDGEGGLVWIKPRGNSVFYSETSRSHGLYDTERGVRQVLNSNTTAASANLNNSVIAFNSNGFDLDQQTDTNENTVTFTSWTFRKAPKFFDIVTGTTDSSGNITINHDLGVEPGFVMVKRTDSTSNWFCYHRSLGVTKYLNLDTTGGASNYTAWGNITSTTFSANIGLGNAPAGVVIYLFAHNNGDGGFGESGDQDIIKCGSYTGDGSGGQLVDIGWEVQWLLVKRTDAAGDWFIVDVMRGALANGAYPCNNLYANKSDAETLAGTFGPDPRGFRISASTSTNNNNSPFIYIAIRRGPMQTPTSGSEVFNAVRPSSSGTFTANSGFVTDFTMNKGPTNGSTNYAGARLTGPNTMAPHNSNAEFAVGFSFDFMDKVTIAGSGDYSNWISWNWKRAPGFFDVVAYSGTSTIRQQAHNLGVTPEFVIVKGRDFASHWFTYHTGQTGGVDALHSAMRLNLTEASFDTQLWKNYDFNASTFSLDNDNGVNGSAYKYIAYLFASLDGISKVGSYTGNGTSQNINCGFSTGARFVLIKRSDATGNWYLWDTARGIVTGNDPYLILNEAEAENSSYDSVDPYSAGFSVNQDAGTNINVSSGTYIFLAIA